MTVGRRRRWHRVIIPWRKSWGLHVFNVYGRTGYGSKEQEAMEVLIKEMQDEIGLLGNVPWIAGGDWNRTLAEAGKWWDGIGELCCTGQTTQQHGRELDWFVVAAGLGQQIGRTVETGPLPDHWGVVMDIPGFKDIDLGMRLRRPRVINVGTDDQRTHQLDLVHVPWGGRRSKLEGMECGCGSMVDQTVWMYLKGI